MAVVKVKVLNIIGRMFELEKVANILGKSNVFHPDYVLSFYTNTAGFSPVAEENPYAEPLRRMTDTRNAMGKKAEPNGKHSERLPDSVSNWDAYTQKIVQAWTGFSEKRVEHQQIIASLNREIEKVQHFTGLDIRLNEVNECRFIKIRFGFLPAESYAKLDEIKENPYVVFFPSTSDQSGYWGMYCAPIDQIEEIDRIFSGLNFERTRFTELSGTPEQYLSELDSKRDAERKQIEEVNRQINDFWEQEKKDFEILYSWLSEKYICFGIQRYAARYGDSFILTGWIPAERESGIKKQLDSLSTIRYAADAAEDPEVLAHSPPIILKNRKIFSPFEFFIKIYGMPRYNEMDPTPVIAFTYALIFGIMFADLGQGICISVIGWLMWKKFHMSLGKAMIPCGIASALFGTAFGSVFGFEHALDPFYQTVFHLPEKPISVMDGDTTIKVIYSAVGLGIFLVILAIAMNIISSLRRGELENGLFGPNGVAGFVFYVSLVAGALGQLVLGLKIMTPVYVLVLIVLPVVVMLFREPLGGLVEGRPDWKPESMGNYIMQNFFEVFEFLLSYLTNTISFIRVGAFVLVHAGMMLVVFTLAESSSGIGYLLILLIGNAFVIALEGLLSGIQTLRLEFYEMFSRFFDGAGRAFAPVVVSQES